MEPEYALRDPKWLERAVERQHTKAGQGEWAAQIKACKSELAEIKKKEAATIRVLGEGLSEEACREQLQLLARQRDTAQRSLDLAEKALDTRNQEQAAMASMKAEMARLRARLASDDFGVKDSVIAALTPVDGPLATLHSNGTIELHGILSLDALTPPSHASE